jgi:anthranilate synthase component II
MRILVIDNYDSFTYNLVQYLGELGAELDVVRNDAAPLDELVARQPDGVVISPGPGRPEDAGVTVAAVTAFAPGMPLLGVCLGHQAIGQAFGGHVVRARTIMHGKTSRIRHDGRGVFAGLPEGFEATRYHSLVVEEGARFPEVLEIAARSEDGEIMGLRHRSRPIHGVQFHPESILTGEGKHLLGNFLALCRSARA